MRGAYVRFGFVLTFFSSFLAGLAASTPAFAQGSSFGVKGGVNFATLSAETDPGPDFGYRTGLVAGGFFTWPIASHLDLQPEGLFTQQGATIKGSGLEHVTIKLDSIVVPVLVRYRLRPAGQGLVLFAGPSIGFNVQAKAAAGAGDLEVTDDFKDQVEDVDYGLVFGGAWESGRFLIEGRYSWGLSVLSNDPDDADQTRHRVISVMAGFRF
jgi:hypothetical protein